MKLKLAIDCSRLTDKYPSGTHRFLLNFLNTLSRDYNYDLTFFFREKPKIRDMNFIEKGKVIVLENENFFTQIGILKHLEDYDYFVFPWQTCPFLGFMYKKKIISIIHDSGFSLRSKVTTFLTQMCSGKVFSVSEATAEKLVVPSVVLGEGVSTDIFYRLKSKEVYNLRERLKVPNFFILSLGRVEKRKNIYNNLKAFKEVKKYYPKLKYVFIGKIIEDENKIYSFIASLNIPRSEIVFKNFVSDYDLNVYLNSTELLLFTPFEEGFGLPLLEAYSVGKPAVISKIPAFKDLKISDKQMCDPEDIEKIAEKVCLCLKDTASFYNQEKVKSILNRNSWENCVKIFVKNLEK
jgi:glycosyltransferase involved in cell wall biosynthesis